MNTAERQAIRERHAEEYGLCVYCFVPDTYNGRVGEWMPALYPCDTIKVLDATEPAGTEFRATYIDGWMPVNECDHRKIPSTLEGISIWLWFTYCPKCGEKL